MTCTRREPEVQLVDHCSVVVQMLMMMTFSNARQSDNVSLKSEPPHVSLVAAAVVVPRVYPGPNCGKMGEKGI